MKCPVISYYGVERTGKKTNMSIKILIKKHSK